MEKATLDEIRKKAAKVKLFAGKIRQLDAEIFRAHDLAVKKNYQSQRQHLYAELVMTMHEILNDISDITAQNVELSVDSIKELLGIRDSVKVFVKEFKR